MPPDEGNTEENLIKNEEKVKISETDSLKSEIITSQPEKEKVDMNEEGNKVIQPPLKQNEDISDSLACIALCCGFFEQCWISLFPCFTCCHGELLGQCVNGSCDCCLSLMEGIGECCTQC